MKRPIISTTDDLKMKKIKTDEEKQEDQPQPQPQPQPQAQPPQTDSVLLVENLLYEILKHADARTLGACACVSKQWRKTAQDETLWELICTKQWANIGCGKQQLRSVVLALGGFRRLHALYLWPLAKPPSSASASSSSAWPCLPPPPPAVVPARAKTRWGKDEVHLSLSLLSIRYYEKMNFRSRGK